MGFRRLTRIGPGLFALGIGVRAFIVGGLLFLALQLLLTQRYYATALVVMGLAAFVLGDIARTVSRADRMFEQFIQGLQSQEFERPAPNLEGMLGFRRLAAAIEHAVTSLSAARAARQRQIDYLETLVDNMSVAALVVEVDGSITLANRAARKLAGEPVNRLADIAAVGPALAGQILDLSAGQKIVVRLNDGQRVLASTARFSSDGATRLLLSLQNIESELDAVELKAWQDLTRILAHEMMNSLTPISSLAESIRPLLQNLHAKDQNPSDMTVTDVATAIDAIARRSVGLISFVERYRKLANLPRPALHPVRLFDLIARIESLLASTLSAKSIALTITIDPGDMSASLDSDLIEQALINLLRNAVDAVADCSDPKIEIACRRRDPSRVVIAVGDNGPGLDPALLDQIFVPFFTTKTGGSGIGLSLVRQIALAHGGQVEVAQNGPNGTVFSLVIPAPART